MSSIYAAQASPGLRARSSDADDAALLVRIGSKDKAALALLYRAYHQRLVRFLARFTRRHDLIEEVINDTFLIVWRKAVEFRGQSRVSTWLIGIAYRVTLKALREGGALAEPLTADYEGESVDPYAGYEMVDWVTKGLSCLSPEQRLVTELAYVMGHSLEEIAMITDSPVSTVKARMFHARVKLRNLMPVLASAAGESQ
jgi:RNA polymerase sigma-70 factor, ECF subfamily